MGPRGPREVLQEAIDRSLCRVRPDPVRGGMLAIDCPTYEARAHALDLLAYRDAHHDGAIRELARYITRGCAKMDPESIARAVHRAVRDRVRYAEEAGDMIQDPIVTWEDAVGDCDCQARLVLALVRSFQVASDLARFPGETTGEGGPEVRHVCAVWLRQPWGRIWMETSIPAEFGEHPQDAARRLFSARGDL